MRFRLADTYILNRYSRARPFGTSPLLSSRSLSGSFVGCPKYPFGLGLESTTGRERSVILPAIAVLGVPKLPCKDVNQAQDFIASLARDARVVVNDEISSGEAEAAAVMANLLDQGCNLVAVYLPEIRHSEADLLTPEEEDYGTRASTMGASERAMEGMTVWLGILV